MSQTDSDIRMIRVGENSCENVPDFTQIVEIRIETGELLSKLVDCYQEEKGVCLQERHKEEVT